MGWLSDILNSVHQCPVCGHWDTTQNRPDNDEEFHCMKCDVIFNIRTGKTEWRLWG